MKHDFRSDSDSPEAAAFVDWLRGETVAALNKDYGSIDATAATIFLFVNRAYEAGLPEPEIGRLFGECIARAGYSEEEQEVVVTLLERQASIARQVHAPRGSLQ